MVLNRETFHKNTRAFKYRCKTAENKRKPKFFCEYRIAKISLNHILNHMWMSFCVFNASMLDLRIIPQNMEIKMSA